MAKSDVLVRMKADVSGYDANIAKARRSLDQFKQDNLSLGGVLNQTVKSLTAAAAGFASLSAAAGAIKNLIDESVQLAKAGEGVRIAFERLNEPGLLDSLRTATHNTVTDIELMKAAVKFNDFKLPVQELGTMLAFAQQKAKDTGQSIDYMVDSIVTGLGRKSLMILDNLGLSASEIREKMKETGDMTKAVGEIIREQMSKAGEYMETAADRAAQANVSLQNKMEELGRKFAPLQEASNNLWTSIKLGIMDIIGGPLTVFINKMTEAGRIANQYGILGGNSKVGRLVGNLSGASEDNRQNIYKRQQQEFWRYINRRENYMKDRQRWVENPNDEGLRQKLLSEQEAFGTNNVNEIKAQITAAKQMLSDYQQAAKTILSPEAVAATAITSNTPTKGGKGSKTFDINKIAFNPDKANVIKPADFIEQPSVWAQYGEGIRSAFEPIKDEMENLTEFTPNFNPYIKNMEKMAEAANKQKMAFNLAGQAADSFGAALSSIDDPAAKAAGSVISAIANIALGFSMASVNANTAGTGWGWLAWVAAGASAMATTIATIHSLTGYAQGGEVKGNSFSGDNIPIMANAGEVVLTKAMQSNLASQLNGGTQNLNLYGVISGENIVLTANRYLQRKGKGELVTWRN